VRLTIISKLLKNPSVHRKRFIEPRYIGNFLAILV